MPLLQTALLFAFPALVIVAALHDAVSMTIPNWISAALIAGFAVAALAVGLPLAQAGTCLAVGVGALVAGMIMFALRWIGGGDAKMFASAALWLGTSGGVSFVLWTALAGGALALALLGGRRMVQLVGFPVRPPAWIGRLLEPEGDIPYGIAICVGALLAFPQSPLFLAAGG